MNSREFASFADYPSPVLRIPKTMSAVVYRGVNDLHVETVPVPQIRADEILVKVLACGVCPTDIKKIQYATAPFWTRDSRHHRPGRGQSERICCRRPRGTASSCSLSEMSCVPTSRLCA